MDSDHDNSSISWLIEAIRRLPSDEPVPKGTPGYNVYDTQKAHWLGWLDPAAGTGTYQRRATEERDARYVYNHIGEPKMLLWLISAAGLDPRVLDSARRDAEAAASLAGKAAAIRKRIPWALVAAALSSR